ncbi:hypothetical protein [Halolamina salifodinae]|uniref:Uncharacterized protein n=1 Tax=Halolamina salifodinae TaxID=1202767 RepID=A0A8T4GUT8_9EURY|nr:hypothetical protein [Halolamina salifodinae]MBP1986639.1 hypothetical protein [Halolamina salifodinae]
MEVWLARHPQRRGTDEALRDEPAATHEAATHELAATHAGTSDAARPRRGVDDAYGRSPADPSEQ